MEKQQCIQALSLMLKSRIFEDRTEELFKAGYIHGTTHLANGQEASQAGLCMALDKNDWIVPTHRCHGFTLCKGSDPYAMFSEMFGSKHGLAKGLGGSMHMPDKDNCNLGSSAVVASGIPLATGVAFYMKRKKFSNISVAIFGDGATSRGALHECMNLASVWNLPLLFFCENNHYGMSAPSSKMISGSGIAERSKAYNIEFAKADGNDFDDVFNTVSAACSYIREKQRPYFIEVNTYRQKGHSKSDKRVYRSREEEEFWLKKDPIVNYKKKLIDNKILNSAEIEEIENAASACIEDCIARAQRDRNDVLTQEETLNLVFAEKEDRT